MGDSDHIKLRSYIIYAKGGGGGGVNETHLFTGGGGAMKNFNVVLNTHIII